MAAAFPSVTTSSLRCVRKRGGGHAIDRCFRFDSKAFRIEVYVSSVGVLGFGLIKKGLEFGSDRNLRSGELAFPFVPRHDFDLNLDV
ncbi:hypothetical protein AKJ16_DCAP18272 [Drosera capensis]